MKNIIDIQDKQLVSDLRKDDALAFDRFYHGYEKGFHTFGRQTLMMQVEWTEDHCFGVPEGVTSSDTIPVSAGTPSFSDNGLSDDFSGDELGLQWQFFRLYKPECVSH